MKRLENKFLVGQKVRFKDSNLIGEIKGKSYFFYHVKITNSRKIKLKKTHDLNIKHYIHEYPKDRKIHTNDIRRTSIKPRKRVTRIRDVNEGDTPYGI